MTLQITIHPRLEQKVRDYVKECNYKNADEFVNDHLMRFLSPENQRRIEQEISKEISIRIKEMKDDKVEYLDGETVMRELEEKYG